MLRAIVGTSLADCQAAVGISSVLHMEKMAQGSWGALPFDCTACLVATLDCRLPRHQALEALAALRAVSRHFRLAVDDALQRWRAPPALSAATASKEGQLILAALLRRFRNLHSLHIDWGGAEEGEADREDPPSLGGALLEALASLRRLRSLHLGACRPSAALFRAVAALPALRNFCFVSGGGDPAGSSGSSGSRGRALGGDVEGGQSPSPIPLAACTALASLNLWSLQTPGIEADVVAVLQGTGSLRHIGLFRCIRATAAHAHHSCNIGVATQLTSLDLRCTFTTDDAFTQLFGQLLNLRCLDISGSRNLTDDGFRGITRLAGTLTALKLQGGHQVTEDGATALVLLTNLRSLDVGFSNQMSSDSLLPLIARALTQLTLLDIRGCPRACSPPAFHSLPGLRNLLHLSAQGCRLQPGAVGSLARMLHLQHLDVADNPQLGALDALSSLRQVRHLDVSECGLQDAHLVPLLARLPQARTIILNSNEGLTTAVLEALAAGPSCTHLEVVQASDLQMDGEALSKLLPLLSALQELDVSGAVCVSGSLADGEALLEAAEAAPSLHTLIARNLKPLPAQDWRELVQAGAGRRRLLRVVC